MWTALQTLSQNQFLNADAGSKIRIGFAPTTVDGEVPTNGSLSGINIYNTALSAAQIAALYNNVVGASSPLPATTDVSIATGATLDVNGVTQQIASLTGSAGASVTLGSGQLIVNSTASTQFAGAISGSGSVVKSGSGTLTLSGANSYSGNTTINGGTLAVNGSIAGSIFVNSGAVLRGSGSIGGMVTVAGGGNLSPGNSLGLLSLGGLILQSASQTNIELGGTTRGSQYDAILSSGAVSLDGNLNVSLSNGFLPVAGNSFDILDWNSVPGSLTGAFSSLTLSTMNGRVVWDASHLYDSGTISVANTYYAGDFNRDGQVTVADVQAMMAALSNLSGYELSENLTDQQLLLIGDLTGDGTVSNADLQDLISLLANGGNGASSLDPVPEPSSFILAISAAIVCVAHLARRPLRQRKP